MVHSKTHYSIWKDVQEESHLEDFCHCGFTGVSFSEAKLVSLSQKVQHKGTGLHHARNYRKLE